MKLTNEEIEMLTQAEKKAESTIRNKKILALFVLIVIVNSFITLVAMGVADEPLTNFFQSLQVVSLITAGLTVVTSIAGWAIGVLNDD